MLCALISAWVRHQTRVSIRLPQGVLRFRTVGNCSSERRVGGIVRLTPVEVNWIL